MTLQEKQALVDTYLSAYRNLTYAELNGRQVRVVAHKMWTDKTGRMSYAFDFPDDVMLIIKI